MIDKIKCKKRIGCDIHKQLIALLQYAQEHEDELPERILEEEYKTVQANKADYPDWYLGLLVVVQEERIHSEKDLLMKWD